MSKIKDAPAFPSKWTPEEGMTLRQHYAGLAMQGILSSDLGLKTLSDGGVQAVSTFCKVAVDVSEALIAELEKQEVEP